MPRKVDRLDERDAHQDLDFVAAGLTEGQVLFICPVRNEEARVRLMLASLQMQSVRDWIALFVDNSSNDGTLEILSRAAAEDNRISVLSRSATVEVHQNFRDSILFGLSQFASEFVQFIAADDELGSPDYLELAILAVSGGKASFCIGEVEHFDIENILETNRFFAPRSNSWIQVANLMAREYWRCNAIYGFYVRDTFISISQDSKYGFTTNMSSDWWFSFGAHLSGSLAIDTSLKYRKFRKGLSYDDPHYRIRAIRSESKIWVKILAAPFKRLGDRSLELSPVRSLALLLLFLFWDLGAVFKKLTSRSR